MLLQHKAVLSQLRIVLASQSPRRHQIFRDNLGLSNFVVIVSNFKEDIDKATCSGPEDYVSRTCRMKCIDVINSNSNNNNSDNKSESNSNSNSSSSVPVGGGGGGEFADIIISSDTIVVLGDKILEKPADRFAAFEMLRSLSGRSNRVLSAVTIASLKCNRVGGDSSTGSSSSTIVGGPLTDLYNIKTFCQSSNVNFAHLTDEVINAYIDSGEPFDKAGGYGMQSLGASLVTSIEGCFFNVMGFPVFRFCEEFLPIIAEMKSNDKRREDI